MASGRAQWAEQLGWSQRAAGMVVLRAGLGHASLSCVLSGTAGAAGTGWGLDGDALHAV